MDFLLTSPNQKIYIHENLGISKPDYVICIMHFPIQQCFFKAKKKKEVLQQHLKLIKLCNCSLQKLISNAHENSYDMKG